MEGLEEPLPRYLGMIDTASDQLARLLDDLGLAARIESGRYDPVLRTADTLELAREAAERVDAGTVGVSGRGAEVQVDPEALRSGLAALARCALRHGGVDHVAFAVEGPALTLGPVVPQAAPILLGDELRDLGSAVAVSLVRALGGSVELQGETLLVRLADGTAAS